MAAPIIEVKNLSKSYTLGTIGATRLRDDLERWWQRWKGEASAPDVREFQALKDVSFNVQRGEVLGIIGRNGAGKSTLLKILSRITEPTKGEVIMRGRVASLLEVGTGFHPDLTGRENIFLNGAIMGMTRVEVRKKLDEIVAFAEVEQFLDTPVKRYSSGMYVRLAFAVAAHLEPEILIVDEVLAVGDLQFQEKCLGKMRAVAEGSGRTVLFVSHQLSAVRKLCTRALLLDHGRIAADGDVESVLRHYLAQNSALGKPVTALPPGDPDSPAQGIELTLLNASNKEASEVLLGEPWRSQLLFEVRRPLRHCIVATGIRTTGGVPVITWWSEPANLNPGRYVAVFPCDVPLSAGEYNFVVGISNGEKAVYYIEDSGRLAISDVAAEQQPFRASGAGICFSRARPIIQPLA